MMLRPGAIALACSVVSMLLTSRAVAAQLSAQRFKTDGHVRSSPLIGPDGTLYVGSLDSNVYAIRKVGNSWETKWRFRTSGLVYSSPVLGPDGTLYVGCAGGVIYAINTMNGSEKWRTETELDRIVLRNSAIIGPDGTLYVGFETVGGWTERAINIIAFFTSDGKIKWSSPTFAGVQSSPVLDYDGFLYVGSNRYLHAFNSFLETELRGLDRNDPVDRGRRRIDSIDGDQMVAMEISSTPLLGPDGTLYVCWGKAIIAIDVSFRRDRGSGQNPGNFPLSRAEIWRYTTDGRIVYSSPVLGPDGTLYVGSDDHHIYAIHTLRNSSVAAGSLKWRYRTQDQVLSSPILGPDGTLYVGSNDDHIYAIHTLGNSSVAGSLKWRFRTGGNVESSPVLGPDGTLYVGSNDNHIYAIDTGVPCVCSAGTFLNSSAFSSCSDVASVCAPCPTGLFCPHIRAHRFISAVPCPHGFFCDSIGMSAPNPCPAGYHSRVHGAKNASVCQLCPSRTFCYPEGRAQPIACPRGSFCPSSHVPPTRCPAGSFNNVTNGFDATACLPCPAGKFCDGQGLWHATNCPSSHFCPDERMTAPSLCTVGNICNTTNLISPIPCPAGSFCPSAGSIEPLRCNRGFFCPVSGLSAQLPCPAGRFCQQANMITPTPCPAGFFSPITGALNDNVCQPCHIGSYCPEGAIRSIPCKPGSFNQIFNATQSSDCIPCPINHASSSGASRCTPCGERETSQAGDETCRRCVCAPFSISGFSCCNDTEQAGIVLGWITSAISAILSIYKVRLLMIDRVHVLKDHGIKPNLKRVIFLQRTLARHLKRELQPIMIIRDSSEMLINTTQSEQNVSYSSSDVALVGMVSDLQTRIQQQQQVMQDLLQQIKDQQQATMNDVLERLRKLEKAMQEPQHKVQEEVKAY
jgi:outer membrane protein assembly factor BamB